jgi:glutathione peroxidase
MRRLPSRFGWMLLAGIVVTTVAGITACTSRGEQRPETMRVADSVFEFTLNDIKGQPHDFAQYRGKVLLIVNVASKCGYTGQYAALQALYEKYRERGLVIIGVPANDFLWQESGNNEQIAQFCSTTYGVTFPMMAKVEVTGDDRDPLYWYLTCDSARPGKIGWNFTKFLIGRDGRVIERFGPSTAPDAKEVVAAIEIVLAGTIPRD